MAARAYLAIVFKCFVLYQAKLAVLLLAATAQTKAAFASKTIAACAHLATNLL